MSWDNFKLGDICTITKGNIGIQKAIPGKYPLVVLGEGRKTHNQFQFDTDAVVIPVVSSTGHGHRSMKRIFFQSGKFSIGSILCAVIPKDSNKLSAEFLYRYLEINKDKELVSRMRGMANVTLPIKEIAEINIPLPSLEEQNQITRQISKLESLNKSLLLESSNQAVLIKELRQSILLEAFKGNLTNANKTKIKNKIDSDEEDLGEKLFDIPRNWKWVRFGDIGSSIIGLTYKPSEINIEGISVLKANNIQNYKIELKDIVKVTTKVRENQFTKKGDIVICVRSGSANLIGKSAIIEINGMTFGAFMTLYRSPYNKYVHLYMQSELFSNQINDKKSTGINQLTQNTLKNILIPLPPQPEQDIIVKKIKLLFDTCDKLELSVNSRKSEISNLFIEGSKKYLKI